jgi:hypothetical protein
MAITIRARLLLTIAFAGLTGVTASFLPMRMSGADCA